MANALADLQSSATAMACCAKAKYECAGLRGPDDCCRQMGHTAGRTAVGTFSTVDTHVAAAAVMDRSLFLDVRSFGPLNPPSGLKRPHDPPHLHQYNPLI